MTLIPGIHFPTNREEPLTGCTPPPDEDKYAIAVGSDKDFAGLELRSIFIVASAENEPGRILGTIFNPGTEKST